MTNHSDIQAEIDGKDRLLLREHVYRKMWAVLVVTHVAAIWIPQIVFIVLGLGLYALCHSECLRLVRETSALAKRRKAHEERVDAFVEERGDAIRARMQAMMETEARDRARRSNSKSMFRGNCIDVTPE